MINTNITFKEALIDVIRFYGENPLRRSCIEGDRIYMHDDGRKCAIGRYIRPGKEETFRSFENGNIESVVHAYQTKERMNGRWINEYDAIIELLCIQDASMDDLAFLQILHDEDNNWGPNGLSEFGEKTIEQFRPDIAEEVLRTVKNQMIIA